MTRFAKIYVSEQCSAPQGVKTLLAINGIECVEVDVSDDKPTRELIRGRTGQGTLPVVELEVTGRYQAGRNQLVMSYVRSAATGDRGWRRPARCSWTVRSVFPWAAPTTSHCRDESSCQRSRCCRRTSLVPSCASLPMNRQMLSDVTYPTLCCASLSDDG